MTHHVDRSREHGFVEVLATLQQHHQLLDQAPGTLGVGPLEVHLVATNDDGGGGKGTLDLAHVDVAGPTERRHHMRTGDDNRVGGCGRGHTAGAAPEAAEALMWTRG